jgi:hypothetical protein
MHAEKHELYVDEANEVELPDGVDAAAAGQVEQYVSEAPPQTEHSEAANDAVVVMGCGIADVLFPANPPAPVNARLIKRFGLEDERKPRGLASAAGWYRPAEPGSN